MSKIILLDSGPLGIAANPTVSTETAAFNRWLHAQFVSGIRVGIPDIADYEIRRELIRANKTKSLWKLDALQSQFDYLPVGTSILRRAAQLWAQARNMGKPTADALSLDADVIIAAQASLLIEDGDEVIIATTNPKHLSLFVPAARWQDIT
ncbi:MAG: type II toxin-antitoxin system VapC family toxin [Blastocatellia bacterium]